MIPVNYVAVFVVAILSMVLGFLWYGPLFGKPWAAMMGFTTDSMDAAKQKGMGKSYALMFVGSLVTAYVFSHVVTFGSAYTHTSGIWAGLSAGLWVWIGFFAPIQLGSVLWEGKPWKLWLINTSYYLTLLLISGALLSVWK